jgi:glucosamine--fructose-6-phosphate aminotransferase (isomerizing)
LSFGSRVADQEEVDLNYDFSVLDGKYLQDLLVQPRALSDTLQSLEVSRELQGLVRRLGQGRFQRIILTGMGSSYFVLHPLYLELARHGFTPIMVETSELVHYLISFFEPRTLILVVSQSGRSAEVIRLLRLNRGRAALLAVTNTPDSPLAQKADATLLTRAGVEFSVSCKTYVTALMVLNWLGSILAGRDPHRAQRELKEAGPAVSSYLANWKDRVKNISEALENIRHLFLVGRGPSLAAVGTGALIIKESDLFHAEGMSSAAFRHGPLEMVNQDMFVLIFSGDAKTRTLNLRLREDIQERGGRAEMVGEDALLEAFRLPAVPASLRLLLEILVVQMITLALSWQVGREPGRFEWASKVTTTE